MKKLLAFLIGVALGLAGFVLINILSDMAIPLVIFLVFYVIVMFIYRND